MAGGGKDFPAWRDVAGAVRRSAVLTCMMSCSELLYVRTTQYWSCPCAKHSRK